MQTMEYGKAFSYAPQEANWIGKLLIAAFVPFVPIIGGIVSLGYTLEITRRVIKGESVLLPEWSDFGGFLKTGFQAFVVALVYALPLLVIAICGAIPVVALAAQEDETLTQIAVALNFCMSCVLILLALGVAIILPAAFGKLADTGEMSAALRVGEVFNLVRAKPGVYVIVALLSIVGASVLSSVGTIACGIGAFVGVAYAGLANAHLHGQAYRVASAEGGTTPMMPDAPAA